MKVSVLSQQQDIRSLITQNTLSVTKVKLQQHTTPSDSLELLFLVGYIETDLSSERKEKEEEEVKFFMPPNADSNPQFSGLQILKN